jgi:uncharacterized DUF497 family protein
MRLPGVEWDEAKNELNKQDHNGLSFEVAQYVLLDPERIERLDRSEHNTSGEYRYQTLGKVGPVFFVVLHGAREKQTHYISKGRG